MSVEENISEFAKLALTKYWTFFGVTSVALLTFAIADGFPKWIVELSPGWRTVCFLLGLLLLIACFAVIWRELRSESSLAKIGAADYGVLIQRPENGESVSLPILFSGTLEKIIPDDLELWLCTYANDSPPKYWPQIKAEVVGNKWSCRMADEWMFRNGRADYRFLIVGKNGQVLQRLYRGLNNLHHARTSKWLGPITELTDDMAPCTSMRNLIWKDYRGGAE